MEEALALMKDGALPLFEESWATVIPERSLLVVALACVLRQRRVPWKSLSQVRAHKTQAITARKWPPAGGNLSSPH